MSGVLEFVRPKGVRVEWQLYELGTSELHRCPPKDDSYRDIDTPGFLATLAELGYVRNAASGELAAHWRRSGFATWLFHPAATGWYSKRGQQEAHPVPLVADPWPGIPARGRGASHRAEMCWLPISSGLSPHGLRHTHKTLMREAGIPPKLMDERMGHEDGSVQSRYDHITQGCGRRSWPRLPRCGRRRWGCVGAMSPGSPVAVLDHLLKARE